MIGLVKYPALFYCWLYIKIIIIKLEVININSEYTKPVIISNDELAEGVYTASGSCYTVSARITQVPEYGRNNYCIQLNAAHDANHHSGTQKFTLTFNQPVSYVSSNAANVYGSGTNVLTLEYNYHSNNSDNIGLGNIYVESNSGLNILSASCVYCDMDCGQH